MKSIISTQQNVISILVSPNII